MQLKSKLVMLFCLSSILFTLSTNSGCKTPQELGYVPDFDSLYPPPPAPILINPVNDTGYAIHLEPVTIPFVWTPVEGKEYYLFQYCRDRNFDPQRLTEIQVQDSTLTLDFRSGDYYWRVCAYCREWTWYTDWSQVRFFWVVAVH